MCRAVLLVALATSCGVVLADEKIPTLDDALARKLVEQIDADRSVAAVKAREAFENACRINAHFVACDFAKDHLAAMKDGVPTAKPDAK